MLELNSTREDQIAGCILGGAAGDAFGVPFEGTSGTLTLDLMGRRVSDDTQLTLATCEALIETNCVVEPSIIASRLASWFREGRVHGIGASTYKALFALVAGGHWAVVGRKGEYAAGNGAAMRIAPLAFCLDPHNDEARRIIRDVSRITHHHEEAYVGALCIVVAIRAAWDGSWKGNSDLVTKVAEAVPDSKVRDQLAELATIKVDTPIVDVAHRFGSSGYVVESVPLAIYAAQQVSKLGYLGVIRSVIAAGGDTDTIASMSGQVVGTLLGVRSLPMDLVQQLDDFTLMDGIVNQFVAKVEVRNTSRIESR